MLKNVDDINTNLIQSCIYFPLNTFGQCFHPDEFSTSIPRRCARGTAQTTARNVLRALQLPSQWGALHSSASKRTAIGLTEEYYISWQTSLCRRAMVKSIILHIPPYWCDLCFLKIGKWSPEENCFELLIVDAIVQIKTDVRTVLLVTITS